ncbi:uncharacterized protein LOC121973392, partial [Zingiber officinale]|uniref:uncharacterized protein LOC121973392 n=1 Tax=Zingiber officinale TaxID=94328 RepID=UPI001C4B7912
EDISMDFIVGLPRTTNGFDAIWVIVDRLTKSTHFLAIRISYSMEQLAQLYLKEIVRLHGVPRTIILDRDITHTRRSEIRFGGKLAPRYIGPFEILERIGAVAYRLALPPSLSGVHDVFHVSMLRRYVPDPTHVLADIPVPVQPDITYEEVPVRILDRKERQLRNKTIWLVKVGWQYHSDKEATWELEDTIRARYPH